MKRVSVLSILSVLVILAGIFNNAKASDYWWAYFNVPYHSVWPEPIVFVNADEARVSTSGSSAPVVLWIEDMNANILHYSNFTPSEETNLNCLFGKKDSGVCNGWPENIPEGRYRLGFKSDGVTNHRDISLDKSFNTQYPIVNLPDHIDAAKGIYLRAEFQAPTRYTWVVHEKGRSLSYCALGGNSQVVEDECQVISHDSQGLEVSLIYKTDGVWVHRIYDVGVTKPKYWVELGYQQKKDPHKIRFFVEEFGKKKYCGGITKIEWSFGDETQEVTYSPVIQHRYSNSGLYFSPTAVVYCSSGDIYKTHVDLIVIP